MLSMRASFFDSRVVRGWKKLALLVVSSWGINSLKAVLNLMWCEIFPVLLWCRMSQSKPKDETNCQCEIIIFQSPNKWMSSHLKSQKSSLLNLADQGLYSKLKWYWWTRLLLVDVRFAHNIERTPDAWLFVVLNTVLCQLTKRCLNISIHSMFLCFISKHVAGSWTN